MEPLPEAEHPGWVMAFDLERTGSHSEKHRTVGLGLAVVDKQGRALELQLVKGLLSSDVFEERCAREFWDKQPHLLELLRVNQQDTQELQELLPYGGSFLQSCIDAKMVTMLFNVWADHEAGATPKGAKVNQIPLLTDAPGFDVTHFNRMVERVQDQGKYDVMPLPFGPDKTYRGVTDVDSYVEGVLDGCGNRSPGSQLEQLRRLASPEELGMVEPQHPHDHDPSHDAYYIAYLYQYARAVVNHRNSKA